jgi:DNA-binding PadR family transcriptional regulator
MSFKLNKSDYKTLEYIAEYRILTVTQIATIFHKSRQVVRRRLNNLEQAGFIEITGHEIGRGRGRPESYQGLTKCGVDLLRDKGLVGRDVPYENVAPVRNHLIDHQFLLNWFRIHLNEVEKVVSNINVKFFASTSPALPEDKNGCILITNYSPVPDNGIQGVKFTPDAAFSISDSDEDMTCLYFLEVDRGTETRASTRRDMTDVRQKLVNYQWYFHSQAYKRYEQVFKCQLHGFRLLFLTSTAGRLSALCELTQRLRPSNFVYLTEISRLFPEGVSAEIWTKGNDINGPQQSILDDLCCKAPLP